MPDALDQDVIIHDDINDPVITDSRFPESSELSRKTGERFGAFNQILFDMIEDKRSLSFSDFLQVSLDRFLINDSVGQVIFSSQRLLLRAFFCG